MNSELEFTNPNLIVNYHELDNGDAILLRLVHFFFIYFVLYILYYFSICLSGRDDLYFGFCLFTGSNL